MSSPSSTAWLSIARANLYALAGCVDPGCSVVTLRYHARQPSGVMAPMVVVGKAGSSHRRHKLS